MTAPHTSERILRRPGPQPLWLALLVGCTGSTGVELPGTPTDSGAGTVPCTNVVDRLEGDELDSPRGALDFPAAEVLAALDTTANGLFTPGPDQTPVEPHDLVITVVPAEPVVHLSETPPPSDPDRQCLADRYVLQADITIQVFETSTDTGLPPADPAMTLSATVEITAEAADRILLLGSGTPDTGWTAPDPSILSIEGTLALEGDWDGMLQWSETGETLGEFSASPI